MAQKKIPPKLNDAVLALAAEGATGDVIAEKLNAAHDLGVSGRSVRRFLQSHRDELADIAKAVTREELRKHIRLSVLSLVATLANATKIEKIARLSGENGIALKAQAQVRAAACDILGFAGLNQPDHPGVLVDQGGGIQDARAALLAHLKALVEAAKAPAPADEPPPIH